MICPLKQLPISPDTLFDVFDQRGLSPASKNLYQNIAISAP
jgi:hypothetical protein